MYVHQALHRFADARGIVVIHRNMLIRFRHRKDHRHMFDVLEHDSVLVFIFQFRHTAQADDQAIKLTVFTQLIGRVIHKTMEVMVRILIFKAFVFSGHNDQVQIFSQTDTADYVADKLLRKIRPDILQDQADGFPIAALIHASFSPSRSGEGLEKRYPCE